MAKWKSGWSNDVDGGVMKRHSFVHYSMHSSGSGCPSLYSCMYIYWGYARYPQHFCAYFTFTSMTLLRHRGNLTEWRHILDPELNMLTHLTTRLHQHSRVPVCTQWTGGVQSHLLGGLLYPKNHCHLQMPVSIWSPSVKCQGLASQGAVCLACSVHVCNWCEELLGPMNN